MTTYKIFTKNSTTTIIGDNGHFFTIRHFKSKKPLTRLLKQNINSAGYLTMSSSPFHKRKEMSHRVVWMAFNGPIPKGMNIDHINRIKTDNRLENLRLVTVYKNMKNKTKDDKNENHPHSKITNDQAVWACEQYSKKMTMEEIGRELGVNRKAISAILRGLTYGEITYKKREELGLLNKFKKINTKYDIEAIKSMVNKGFPRSDISKIHNISENYIWHLLKMNE